MRDPIRNPPRGQANGTTYQRFSTVCPYCAVGCGYEAHLWDAEAGTPAPPEDHKNLWMSPSWIAPVRFDGNIRTAAIVPDPKCEVNRGNHSVRGGTAGRNLTCSHALERTEAPSTRERIKSPMLRIAGDQWADLEWEDMLDFLTELVLTATGNLGEPRRVGAKLYGYHSLESTYAASNLFQRVVRTPNVAHHDRPSTAGSSPGLTDAGIDFHAFDYQDIVDCDVVLLLGSNAYECQSVFFTQAIAGRRLVVLDPRRTITADYAANTGGVHLQPRVLGADALILGSISRLVLEHWRASQDGNEIRVLKELVSQPAVDVARTDDHGERRARDRIWAFDEYSAYLLSDDRLRPEAVAQRTGIALQDLRQCASLLTEPGLRSAILYEKGLIWGFNYQNTAAVANLALLTFNFNTEKLPPDDWRNTLMDEHLAGYKRGYCGRLGGHQKGGADVRFSPGEPAPQRTDYYAEPTNGAGTSYRMRWTIPHYVDFHLVGRCEDRRDFLVGVKEGACLDMQGEEAVADGPAPRIAFCHPEADREQPEDISLLWVAGCNPAGQMNGAQRKWARVQERLNIGRPQTAPECVEAAKRALLARVRGGRADGLGLVIIQQDIFPNYTTEFADILLPAATWGETPFTRFSGERRLRLYDRFQDPPAYTAHGKLEPSRCRPDWSIFAEMAKRLCIDRNDTPRSRSPRPWERWADAEDVFASLCEPDASSQSWRLQGFRAVVADAGKGYYQHLRELGTNGFKLAFRRHKQSFFVNPRWEDVETRFVDLQPGTGEVWVANGRVNEAWNSMYSNIRNAFISDRYPDDLPGTLLEVNADWAAQSGIANGDLVRVEDPTHASRNFTALVSIQTSVPPGGAFALFSYPCSTKEGPLGRKFTGEGYVNNITIGYVDPSGPISAHKYAKGRVIKLDRATYSGRLLTSPARNVSISRLVWNTGKNASQRWMARELLVARGLPAIAIIQRDDRGRVVVPHAVHGAFWRTSHANAEDFLNKPLMGQFPLVAFDRNGRPQGDESLIVQILQGRSKLPQMPLRALSLPAIFVDRIRGWIDGGCDPELFVEIQLLLDYAVRIHARMFGGINTSALSAEAVLLDPDSGIDLITSRAKLLLPLVQPSDKTPGISAMSWRDPDGRLLTSWTRREYDILASAMHPVTRPGTLRFADVQALLSALVAGEPVTALHGKFWDALSREQFIQHKVQFAGGEIPVVRLHNGANSALVLALRGEGPFKNFRMPQERLGPTKEAIDAIAEWIDDGCP